MTGEAFDFRQDTRGQCLARIAAGEREALGDLYDQTAAQLLGQAMRILKNREDAEEVLFEVYTQVWRQARDFDPDRGPAGAWLATLLRSRAIDHVRRRVRRQALEQPLTEVGAEWDHSQGPEAQTAANERHSLLRQALKSLPPAQGRAIELAFFAGLSHSEVARKLGEPLGTVKTRIRQGLGRLREHVDPALRAEVLS